MAAKPGFRVVLWTRLGALFLQAAEYFENKRRQAIPLTEPEEQDKVETEAPDSLKGAPAHWLALVRERAPGFLHRLETLSYQHQPASGQNSGAVQSVAGSEYKPAAASKYSVPEQEVHPQKRAEPGVTGPQEQSGRLRPHDEADRDDSPFRLRFQTPEIRSSGQTADQVQQARSKYTFEQAPERKRAEQRAVLRFKSEQQAAVFKPFQPAAIEAPAVTNKGASPSTPKIGGAIKRASPQQSRIIEKSSEIRAASTVESSSKPVPDEFSYLNEQRPVLVRPSQSPVTADPVDRKVTGQAAVVQQEVQTRDRPAQPRQQVTAGNESVSADSFWPDLSGLDSQSMNPGHWPELPEDAWNDFWRQDAAANIKPEPTDTNTTEALWNG